MLLRLKSCHGYPLLLSLLNLYLCLFSHPDTNGTTVVLALSTTPPSTPRSSSSSWQLRRNSEGKPRLCGVVGTTLQLLTRTGLCFPKHLEKLQIDIQAKSNRCVLQGKFDSISIHAIKSQSALLQVQEVLIEGSNLNLGYKPFLIFGVLPLVILLTRPPILTILSCWYLWKLIQRQFYLMAKQQKNKSVDSSPSSSSLVSRFVANSKRLVQFGSGGRRRRPAPCCCLDYCITLTNENLAHSSLLLHASKYLLRALLLSESSILPTMAAAGDDYNTAVATQIMIQQQQQQNKKDSQAANRGQLVLVDNNNNRVVDDSSPNNSYNNKLTKLLSATKFEFREPPTFSTTLKEERGGEGWMILSSRAILPNEEGSLDFVLRTKPEVVVVAASSGGALQFTSPQVRFDLEEAMTQLPRLIQNVLPKVVWIPVGAGVVCMTGQGGNNNLQRVGIANGACRFDGQIHLFSRRSAEQRNDNSAIVQRP